MEGGRQYLEHALLVAGVGVQEHVKLLVGPGRHVGVDAVLRGADATAGTQEREIVQVLEACMGHPISHLHVIVSVRALA